ncbi:MAG: rod shape-determining protein RodA [Bacteroidaceae bacterium]|nr:rod shape-determining protein RodA [Bacteroidaceae bacterium]
MAAVKDKGKGILASLDWVTIVLYIALLGLGWMSVCGATYDFEQGGNFFDFDTRSGMQIVWIATSFLLGMLILTIDERLFDTFSYVLYAAFLVLLFATPFLARDIKGSLSWLKVGPFSIQPAEFAKFATALCVSKYMGSTDYDISRWWNFLVSCLLIVVPMGLIVMQRETGSALVYTAFFLMLYREGMPGCILFAGISAVLYFVVGVRFDQDALWGIQAISLGQFLVMTMILLFTVGMMRLYTEPLAPVLRVFGYGVGLTLSALLFSKYVIPFDVAWVQLGVCLVTIGYLFYLAVKQNLARYAYIGLFAVGSLALYYSADYALNNVLKDYQQTRVRVLLGMIDDPKDAGYNVIQAKIAIGSGGLKGKGFLNGTQTKLKYVPEQETDFIFCTVGEEEGFLGCAVVLGLFLALILRLIHLAERQPYASGRIYGYSVMSIFLFHVMINVGMVLGLAPVIGIPLPFFSYGGSSLWGFTILLFIFLRIDAGRDRFVHN